MKIYWNKAISRVIEINLINKLLTKIILPGIKKVNQIINCKIILENHLLMINIFKETRKFNFLKIPVIS